MAGEAGLAASPTAPGLVLPPPGNTFEFPRSTEPRPGADPIAPTENPRGRSATGIVLHPQERQTHDLWHASPWRGLPPITSH